jgi:diadenosine tetraphosphate (Ap4A) HIT family hydrolase
MPKRQVNSFFNLTPKEIVDCYDLILRCKNLVGNNYQRSDLPFKLETYIGGTQSIPHSHIHLIPMVNNR